MKKKNRVFDVIMAVAIVAVIVSGVMIVGNTKGWFDKNASSDNAIAVASVGLSNIERSGVAYSVNGDTALHDGDIIETKANSQAAITSGKNTFTLAENSEVKIIAADNGSFSLELTKGEVFAVINEAKHFTGLTLGANTVTVNGTVFSANMQTGSSSVYVFEGEVTAGSKTGKKGNAINFVGNTGSVSELKETSLNDFNIEQAKIAGNERELCFTDSALDKVITDREAEIKKAAEEQAKHEAEVIARGGTEKVAVTGGGTTGSGDTDGANVLTCTITIRCDTILDNMADLNAGKNAYVPSNGCILATSTVQFTEGETVYDVLKRACSAAGIQLEYSWTPMYNSYYIEGINNLYEFDCGNESGWMYKVNGWFPNYGCSSYTLKGGDTIVWCYTCKGLGADVGGSVY